MCPAYDLQAWDRGQLLKEYYSNRGVEAGLLKSRLVGWGVTTVEGLLPTADALLNFLFQHFVK